MVRNSFESAGCLPFKTTFSLAPLAMDQHFLLFYSFQNNFNFKVTYIFIPLQNERFQGYTGISQSDRPSVCLAVSLSLCPSIAVSVCGQNNSVCQSAGRTIKSHLVTALVFSLNLSKFFI